MASLLLMIAFFGVFLCDGAVTISPSGSWRGKEGDLVSVNCTFPDRAGSLVFEYDGVDSLPLVSDANKTNTVIVTANSRQFTFQTVGFGVNSVQKVQLNFLLTVYHDEAKLRCKFKSTEFSDFVNVTVLSSPCCNASSPVSINHNTTDPFSPLNCSEIVSRRGNPPVCVQWNVIGSICTGNPTGSCNEFYDINSIGRGCNDVTVECMAKNEVGLTRKVFNLKVKSIPEKPESCNLTFIDRTQGALFTWNIPKDDGGFSLKNYRVTPSVSGVSKPAVSLENDKLEFAFAEGKDDEIIKLSVSANNALGNGPECTSDLRVPYRKCITPTLQSKTRRYLIINCRTIPGGDPMGRYTAYYSGNGLMNSTASLNLPIVISMLAEDISYKIAVEAFNSVGQLENSTTVTFTTNPPGPPAKPILADTSVQAISVSSITLTFPSVKDAGQDDATVTKYIVYMNGRNFAAQQGNTQTFDIMDLDDDTEYTISVSAVNNIEKEGQRSASVKIRTDKKEEVRAGVSTGALSGAIVGAFLSGAIIGAIGSALIARSIHCRSGRAREDQASHAVEMKDSRLYAEASITKKKETTYEDVR